MLPWKNVLKFFQKKIVFYDPFEASYTCPFNSPYISPLLCSHLFHSIIYLLPLLWLRLSATCGWLTTVNIMLWLHDTQYKSSKKRLHCTFIYYSNFVIIKTTRSRITTNRRRRQKERYISSCATWLTTPGHVRNWNLPDLVIVLTPLYGLYFSLKTCREVMAKPETDAIGTWRKTKPSKNWTHTKTWNKLIKRDYRRARISFLSLFRTDRSLSLFI